MKYNVIDFDNEYQTIYFRKAKLFGVNGLVPNVPLSRESICKYRWKLHFVFIDESNAYIVNTARRYINGKPVSDMTMFITYKNIDIKDGNLKEGDFVVTDKFVYRYELKDWAEDMRSGGHVYGDKRTSSSNIRRPNIEQPRPIIMPVQRIEYIRSDIIPRYTNITINKKESVEKESVTPSIPTTNKKHKKNAERKHTPQYIPIVVEEWPKYPIVPRPRANADLPIVSPKPVTPELPKGHLTSNNHPAYNEVDTVYEEVSVWGTKCLMTRGLGNMFSRNSVPDGAFVYYLRDVDNIYNNLPKIIVNRITEVRKSAYFGMLITYKPIKFPETKYRFVVFKRGEFTYTDSKINPNEVDEWLNKMSAEDNNSKKVIRFINNLHKKGALCNIDKEQFNELYREHLPYQFACILKSNFKRGEVYMALHSKKIVWRDIDNRYYNVDGVFDGKGEVYTEIDMDIDDIGLIEKYAGYTRSMITQCANEFPNR